MLITTGFSVGASLIDNVINRDEKLIEKGEEARDSINNTFKEFSNIKNTIDSLGSSFDESGEAITDTGQAIDNISDKYVELSRGVNKLNNENKSLSDSDYQTYLDLSNQLSTLFPELVTGYDAQGNAILNLGSNAQEAASSLRELYDMQLLSANASIGKELQEAFTGTSAQINKYEKQNDEYSNNVEDLTAQIDSLNTLKNAWNEDSFENPRIEIDSRDFANIEEFADYQNSLISSLQKAGIDYTPNLANGIEIDPETGETFQRFVVDLGEATEQQYNEVLAEIVDQVGEKTLEKNNNLSKINANKLLIADQWKALSTSLGQYLQTTDTFDNLNSNLQNAILTNLVDFNHDALTDIYDGDVLSFMYGEFLEPLSGISKSAQEALSEVFTVDSSKLTVGEYENQIEDALEKAFPGDSSLQEEWERKFGFDEAIEENNKQLDGLTNHFKDNVNDLKNMSMDDIELAYDLVINGDFSGNTFDDLKAQIEETKGSLETGNVLDNLSQKVTDAQTQLSNMVNAVAESNSATGLTSDTISILTAQFEELDGFNPAQLFENTATGVRLNEEQLRALSATQEQIVQNDFVDAINDQNKAIQEQYDILSDSSGKYSEEQKEAAKTALETAQDTLSSLLQQQSIYQSIISDRNQWFQGTTEAYDNYNTVLSRMESLQNMRRDSQGNEWIGSNEFRQGTDYFYSGSLDTVSPEEIAHVYDTLMPLVQDWYQTNSEGTLDVSNSLAAFKSDVEGLENILGGSMSSIDDENKKVVLSAGEMAAAYGVSAEVLEDIAGLYKTLGYDVEWTAYDREQGTVESPGERTFADAETQQSYDNIISKIQTYDGEVQKLTESFDGLTSSQLRSINMQDGIYDAEYGDAERGLESLCDLMGIGYDQAGLLITALEACGLVEIDPQFNDTQIQQGIQSLQEAQELGNLTSEIDITADVTTMGMDELQNRLDALEEYRPQIEAEFGVDSSELDAYDQLIENTELQIKVQTILDDTGYTIEQLQGMTEGELVEVGFTPGDTSQIQAYLQSLNGETAEIPMTVKIDESQFSLLTNLTNETAEVNVVPKNPEIEVTVKDATVKVTPKPNPIDVDAKETTVPVKAEPNPIPVGVVSENGNSLLATLNLGGENQNVTASATVSGTEDVANLKAQIDTLYDRVVTEEAEVIGTDDVIALKAAIDSLYSKTVTATALTSGILSVQSLADAINSLSSKTVTVTTNYVTTGSPGGGRASGTLSSPTVVPAHAAGTAYNVINYKNAYKDGKVALDKDEEALVNELGMFYAAISYIGIENLSNAGNSLEPYVPQRNHEIRVSVMV